MTVLASSVIVPVAIIGCLVAIAITVVGYAMSKKKLSGRIVKASCAVFVALLVGVVASAVYSHINDFVSELSADGGDARVSSPVVSVEDGVEVYADSHIPVGSRYPDVPMALKESSLLNTASRDGLAVTSDHVSDPFMANAADPAAMFDELEKDILRNPIMGDMVARGIKQDSSVLKDNEHWIEADANMFDSAFEGDNPSGMMRWVTRHEGDSGFYVTVEYRLAAERLCELLETYENRGVLELASDGYWMMEPTVDVRIKRTGFQGEQATLSALVLVLKAANGGTVSVLGFDLDDKGLMHYDHATL